MRKSIEMPSRGTLSRVLAAALAGGAALSGLGYQRTMPAATMPNRGVTLKSGVLRDLQERTLRHLYNDAKINKYCDGKTEVNGDTPNVGWAEFLPAANDGRMVGMAANFWRWTGDVRAKALAEKLLGEMRNRQRDDGYYGYYPADEFYSMRGQAYVNERKNFDRNFWTQGLLAAHEAGFAEAGAMVRRMFDWLNGQEKYLELILDGPNATNSFPPYPMMLLSPLGTDEDLRVLEKYYDLPDYQELCARGDDSVFLAFPFSFPHVYTILVHDCFLRRYELTCRKDLLAAAVGGWKVFRECYKLPGGLSTICEHGMYSPRSFRLGTVDTKRRGPGCSPVCGGETCGQVFWVRFNAALQEVFPDDASYAAEIEEQLVNVIPTCRDANGRTRYHNFPEGRMKEPTSNAGTCCETSSGLLISDLPRYLHLVERDGIRINQLFAADWSNAFCTVSVESDFPHIGKGRLVVGRTSEEPFAIRVRVPSWVGGAAPLAVNGESRANVPANAYFSERRQWKAGDVIEWDFPMTERKVAYHGWNETAGARRFAHFVGPVLLAQKENGERCPYWSLEEKTPFTCFPAER